MDGEKIMSETIVHGFSDFPHLDILMDLYSFEITLDWEVNNCSLGMEQFIASVKVSFDPIMGIDFFTIGGHLRKFR